MVELISYDKGTGQQDFISMKMTVTVYYKEHADHTTFEENGSYTLL